MLWDRETLSSPRRAIVWQAEHEPHTWALVQSGRYAVGTVDSYLIARMTRGTWHVTDVSNASRKLLFDLEAGDWSDELCALFGQTCFEEGESKCTYGTGSFILTNTGTSVVRSDAGLLSTAAWRSPDGATTYALEGAIFVTGAAVQWLRDGLQIVGNAAETEAIAFEVRDVLETLPELSALRVDGGAAANDWLCQFQADQVGLPVERPEIVETTALGAAFLAGLGTGVWSSTDELRETWALDREFTPSGDRDALDAAYARWSKAVECAKAWTD